MLHPRVLNPADGAMYMTLRHEMLLDSPWAFVSSVGDDLTEDLGVLEKKLEDPENVIVGAETEPGVLVSACGIYRDPKYKARHRAHVWGVYTTPRMRGQGLGHAVVQGAIGVARSWIGVESITVSCSTRATEAIALYRDLGFVVWGTETDAMRVEGVSYDEVHLALFPGG